MQAIHTHGNGRVFVACNWIPNGFNYLLSAAIARNGFPALSMHAQREYQIIATVHFSCICYEIIMHDLPIHGVNRKHSTAYCVDIN